MKTGIIADRALGWFEKFIDNPRFERVQIYYLCVILGFFLGYLYFCFQIIG